MTIPNLMQSNQKRVIEAKLKEDYSILQQVMKYAEYNDLSFEGTFPNNDTGTKTWYETYFQQNVKTNQVCFNKAGCWHSKNPTKTLSGLIAYCNRTGIGVGENIIGIRLNNGSNLIIDGYSSGSVWTYFGVKVTGDGIIVFIDANGDSGPNIIGKDIQAVVFTDNGLVPAGYHMTTQEVDKNCSTNATGYNAGYFCMTKIKNNGWEMPNEVWKRKV